VAWREQTLLSRNAPWITEASDAASDGQGREPHLRAANTIPRA
jgi:hypothetical protein